MADVLENRHGDVLTLELNRPHLRNALSPDMKARLRSILERESTKPSCRALLIRGVGGAFCSGADARSDEILKRRASIEEELMAGMNRIVSLIKALPVPVIAAVQGPAAGAGVGLALAADIVLVAPSARFHLSFTKIGAVPDAGVTTLLTGKLGAARAAALCLLAEVMTADQALDWGLAARLLDEETFDAEALGVAAQLASGPTRALGLTKKLLASASLPEGSLQGHLNLEAAAQAEAFASPDFEEGIRARVEKRAPHFTGE